jgi:hypothetical protein
MWPAIVAGNGVAGWLAGVAGWWLAAGGVCGQLANGCGVWLA